MNFLDKTIEIIDSAILAYTQAKTFNSYGLALLTENDNGLPTPYSPKNEAFIALDDRWEVSVYHRYEGSTFENVNGFGERKETKETASLKVVAFGHRKWLNFKEYEFQQLIAQALTQNNVKIDKAKLIYSLPQNSVCTAIDVFNGELPNAEKRGLKDFMAIMLTYQVQLQYDPACLNLCTPKPVC